MNYDVFISHASEDKDAVARPLAELLQSRGLRVWLDEMELKLGDSLRRSIDRGLANSRYGLVILSPHFLGKEWPQKELDGLVAREDGSEKIILPVWHNVCRADIVGYSPPLADRLAAPTSKGLAYVVDSVVRAIETPLPDQVNASAPERKEKGIGIGPLMGGLIERLGELTEHGAVEVTGVRTGLLDLDRVTDGLQPGTLTLVAGRPLSGKTAFAFEVAQHVGTVEGLPVVLCAPSAPARQTAERLVSAIGRIAPSRLRTARMADEDWANLAEAVERLGRAPIYICDEPSISVFDLQFEAKRRAKLWGAVGAVVVDSLQHLVGNECSDSGEVCRQLKRLARELNCPVLVTSNLTRVVESRVDKRPMLSDLDDIGDFDLHTDVVLFTYRDAVYNRFTPEPDVVEAIIARQRDGGLLGTVKLTLDVSGRLLSRTPEAST